MRMETKDVHSAIVDELCRAFEDLGAEVELLDTVREWGLSLTERQVLDRLRRINASRIVDRIVRDFD